MADDDSTTLKRAKKSKHKKKRQRDNDEDRKAKKKHKKEKKKLKKESIDDGDDTSVTAKKAKKAAKKAKKEKKRKQKELDEKIVSSSAIEFYPDDLKTLQLAKNQEDEKQKAAAAAAEAKAAAAAEEKEQSAANSVNNITLLLFYQYVEPCWDDDQFQVALKFVTDQGNKYGLTGRMRVAKEGLNCTLTGSHDGIRNWCAALRTFDGGRSKIDQVTGETITEFAKTEFKLTDDLPPKQRFPKLHAFEVVEIVNYGLAGSRAPEIAKYGGKFHWNGLFVT